MLDLTWAMSGPQTTRAMADLGATVVRIESTKVTDVARTVAPFPGFLTGPGGVHHDLPFPAPELLRELPIQRLVVGVNEKQEGVAAGRLTAFRAVGDHLAIQQHAD